MEKDDKSKDAIERRFFRSKKVWKETLCCFFYGNEKKGVDMRQEYEDYYKEDKIRSPGKLKICKIG